MITNLAPAFSVTDFALVFEMGDHFGLAGQCPD